MATLTYIFSPKYFLPEVLADTKKDERAVCLLRQCKLNKTAKH